jgi:hypothetical protein
VSTRFFSRRQPLVHDGNSAMAIGGTFSARTVTRTAPVTRERRAERRASENFLTPRVVRQAGNRPKGNGIGRRAQRRSSVRTGGAYAGLGARSKRKSALPRPREHLRVGRPLGGNLRVRLGLPLRFNLSAVKTHRPDRRRNRLRVNASLTHGRHSALRTEGSDRLPPRAPCIQAEFAPLTKLGNGPEKGQRWKNCTRARQNRAPF